MSVMKVARRAAVPAVAGIAVCCLMAAGTPAEAAPASLHVTATISLGRASSAYAYQFSEAPNGHVFYFRGSVVYVVKGNKAPVAALHTKGNILAVAANSSELFVEVGRKVSAYKRKNGNLIRSWTLPGSPAPLTSAGLYAVGSTVWAWTDWATDQSGFEYASVSRFATSSASVHKVSTGNAYPADMAADSTGLYYEAIRPNLANGYLVHVTPAGVVHKVVDVNIDAPLTLAAHNVYLLASHQSQGGKIYLDSFKAASLAVNFSTAVSGKDSDIAGTGAGLLMLGAGKVSVLFANGALAGTLSVPHAVILVPGRFAVVITYSHGRVSLLRLAV